MKLKVMAVAVAVALGESLHRALTGYMGRVGMVLYDMDPKEIKAALDKIGDQVKEAGEKALAEAKKYGDMYAADKPKVDEMLVKQGELQARLLEVEQKAARRGSEEKPQAQTLGEMLVTDDGFKAWIGAGGMKSAQSGYVLPVKAALTSIPTTNTTTTGVAPDFQPGIIGIPQRRMTVRDLISPGRTGSNLIQYVKETGFTNNAATVSETTLKPESDITYELMQSAVVTVAHWIKASKQILDDFAQLQSMIDQRLRYGLQFKEETQLLKGSGVGNNLNGIYTQATAFSAPIAIAKATKIDVIRLMLLQAELALFPSTGIVMHPSDWAAIELTKNDIGAYIFANPQSLAQPALWGRPVVDTPAMTVDTALVGAFKLGAQVFDREDSNVVISSEDQDNFVRNMVSVRNEERLGLAVYRPESFIKNTDLPAT